MATSPTGMTNDQYIALSKCVHGVLAAEPEGSDVRKMFFGNVEKTTRALFAITYGLKGNDVWPFEITPTLMCTWYLALISTNGKWYPNIFSITLGVRGTVTWLLQRESASAPGVATREKGVYSIEESEYFNILSYAKVCCSTPKML
jgi:hypothetical protein